MKIMPPPARIAITHLRCNLREQVIAQDEFEEALSHLQQAEQVLPRSYTLTSFKGPTVPRRILDAIQGAVAIVAQAAFPDAEVCESLGSSCDAVWQENVFHRVLARAKLQTQQYQQILKVGPEGGNQAETVVLPVTNRADHSIAVENIFRSIQVGRLEATTEGVNYANCAVAATYPGDELTTLTVGSKLPFGPSVSLYASESARMAEYLAHGLDAIIHAAVKSLRVPKSLMEVRAAVKRAFAPEWYMHMRTAQTLKRGHDYRDGHAASMLLSAICFRKHLFIANVGTHQALLWQNGLLTPLNVSHASDAKEERDRLGKLDSSTAKFLTERGVSRALVKSSHLQQSRPQVTCLPLEPLAGSTLILVSPGVVASVGLPAMSEALAAAHNGSVLEDLPQILCGLARRFGLNHEIQVVSLQLRKGH